VKACWYLTADLMFPSRVEGVAQRVGVPLVVLPSLAALMRRWTDEQAANRPTLVLIDLATWDAAVAEFLAEAKLLPEPPTVVAYGPHVQTAALEAARAGGCDYVLTRGQFDQQMAAMLSLA
jgi:hypothetical protein